jgi:hypothetical protein
LLSGVSASECRSSLSQSVQKQLLLSLNGGFCLYSFAYKGPEKGSVAGGAEGQLFSGEAHGANRVRAFLVRLA